MIRETPRHGYEIKKRVGSVLGRGVSMNNNVLYPALRRFEDEGVVTSRLQPQQGSPTRRVFRLTEKGQEVLREMLEDFPVARAHDDAEFLTRVAFFDIIDREARLDILETRRRVMQEELGHLQEMKALVDKHRQTYSVQLLAFLKGTIARELEWIEGMKRLAVKEGRR